MEPENVNLLRVKVKQDLLRLFEASDSTKYEYEIAMNFTIYTIFSYCFKSHD